MPQSGQEMLEESIGSCLQKAVGQGPQNSPWETTIV